MARVTVAVTQRESYFHTRRSLESLYSTAQYPFDLVYVDAGSPAPVQRLIHAESVRRGFRLLRRDEFLTPNQARNLALSTIDSEFVAFVDNDVIFRDGWLARLVACADETGADLTGPLTCVGSPPFTRVHCTGGATRIEESESGRRWRESLRYYHRRLSAVADLLVREPTELLDFHCLLVRRSVFERVGMLDEGLRSGNEHTDLGLLTAQSGGTLWFEPAAVVNQLLPRPFPFDRQSLRFFYQRWSRENNRATIEHFRTKWNLAPGDRALEGTHNWLNDRRDIIFRYLHPELLRYGLRKLKRLASSPARSVIPRPSSDRQQGAR